MQTCGGGPAKIPTDCVKGTKGSRGQIGTFGKRGTPGERVRFYILIVYIFLKSNSLQNENSQPYFHCVTFGQFKKEVFEFCLSKSCYPESSKIKRIAFC